MPALVILMGEQMFVRVHGEAFAGCSYTLMFYLLAGTCDFLWHFTEPFG